MSIDKNTARRVAHLARIEVADDQLDRLAAELSNILGFMEQLNEVDVEGVEPMTSVTPMRAASSKAAMVFSGAYADAPRCAMIRNWGGTTMGSAIRCAACGRPGRPRNAAAGHA